MVKKDKYTFNINIITIIKQIINNIFYKIENN